MSQPAGPEQKFGEMGIGGKLVFCVKVCVFFASFGFAFPTLLSA